MNKKWLIIGGVFGLFAPFIGIFIGLQVSVIFGNFLAFPIIALAFITGKPFGTWSAGFMIFAVVLSVVVWALVFGLAQMALRKS